MPQQNRELASAFGDRDYLHIGDYIGFERITPNLDWRLALGKVIALPNPHVVKIALYDPVNRETIAHDPISEEVIRKRAEEEGRMELWHDREAMRQELTAALDAEKSASTDLFKARDATLAKQASIANMTKAALEQLQEARKMVRDVPSRQWRDLRSGGEPTESVVRLVRATLLVLYEDRAVSWPDMNLILKDPNFLDRLLAWDCSMTPMSLPRRNKIVELCSDEDLEEGGMDFGRMAGGRRSGARTGGARRSNAGRRSTARGSPAVVASQGTGVGIFGTTDGALRAWLNAQLAASEASERQKRAVEECYAEQQEQRLQLRKVNDLRTNVSRIEVMMQEGKCAIMGTDPNPNPIMPLDQYPTDTIFYKRLRPGGEGRFVQEVIRRAAVLINFGPLATEDAEGYVRLNKMQADTLRNTVHQANVRHDADEMQELLARKEREEAELAQLRASIDALRARSDLSDEELEELGQLERLLEDAERRHRATLARIADLYACGRGAREITMATKRIGAKFTRLHCKMSGDWAAIIADPVRRKGMEEALCDDVCDILQIPRDAVFDIDARNGSLITDFTVKHSGEIDDEELQRMVNAADFSALSLFYEKVTFKKSSPINTPEQEARMLEELRLFEESRKRELFSGMGIREKLEDYYDAYGVLEEEFGPEITNDVDYRKAIITIPIVREDYDKNAITGPPELYCDDDQDLSDAASEHASDAAPLPQSASHRSSPANARRQQSEEASSQGASKRSSRKAAAKSPSSKSSSHRTPREQEAPRPVARVDVRSGSESEL